MLSIVLTTAAKKLIERLTTGKVPDLNPKVHTNF
jgi:hypothetical protein